MLAKMTYTQEELDAAVAGAKWQVANDILTKGEAEKKLLSALSDMGEIPGFSSRLRSSFITSFWQGYNQVKQESAMKQSTQEQLNDPAWWSKNAPEGATHFARFPSGETEWQKRLPNKVSQVWSERLMLWEDLGPHSKATMTLRPIRPAALPPVGTTSNNSDLIIDCIHPAPIAWEVIAHRGVEAIIYVPESEGDQAEVYLLPAQEFKSLSVERERDAYLASVIENYRKSDSAPGSAAELNLLSEFANHLYDAGLLRKGGE